ncbi:MAG TPA: tetratricopeptide repeat protein [Caulobacteraceae bacterium]|jgi:Flp pilus assembly protein TadD
MSLKPTALLVSTVLVFAGGCAHLPQLVSWAKFKPLVTQADMKPVGAQAASDRLYADAVKAIDQRNYGEAIDLLQVAREGHPGDARVLTAMAVVYDKLGRFDLSDRYYDQAEKADPGSRIVALDRRYSEFLRSGGSATAVAAAQGAAPVLVTPAGPGAPASPARAASAPVPLSGEQLYARAVKSIERREYGIALGDLRQARDAMPGDARVLTALAVTYDHLGRFDLSSRYYDQAEKANPGSVVVAQDRRTSLILQQHGGFDGPEDVIVLAKAAPGKPAQVKRVASIARPTGDRG